jgi:hypothetical protein
LEAVVLPDTVEGIGKMAFYGDTALRRVSIGYNISAIGANAFGDAGLQSLDLTKCNIEGERDLFLNAIFSSVFLPRISPLIQGCVVTFSENDKWVLRDAANKTWGPLAPPEDAA